MNVKIKVFSIAVISLLFLYFRPIYGDSIELSDTEKQLVDRGEIISKEIPTINKPGKTFQAAGLIKASVSSVFETLTDFEKYNEFMPNNEKTTVLERTKQYAVVNITLGLPFNQYKRYRLAMHMENDNNAAMIKWKKIEWPGLKSSETIKDTEGFWYISKFPDKRGHTLVTYKVYTDPGPIPFFLKWIADWMAKNSVPKMITATKNRVEELINNK